MKGTRRAALAAALSLPAATTRATAPSQDAALMKAAAELRGIIAAIKAVEAGPSFAFGSPESEARETRLTVLVRQLDPVMEKIADLPAHTREGAAEKALLILDILPQALDDFDLDSANAEIQIVFSLARDVLTMTGRRA